MFNKSFFLKITVLLMLFTLISPVTMGKEQYFPLEKIKPGMTGIGYTVFYGTKIEKFDVKVLEIVNSVYGDAKLILVRLSGKNLEESGGLAAGMSGSPIYIKGCLVGAISYGFPNADPMLAMVTPIKSMLKIMEGCPEPAPLAELKKGLQPVPAAAPVIFSGMGRRGFELMSRALAGLNFEPVFLPGFGEKTEPEKVKLEPGSAIAVQMVSGDYQVSAIGTVTWVNGRNFLAFGHSFTNKGPVDFYAFQAKILHIVKSREMSYKIGTSLQPFGRIIEDRSVGIFGRSGEYPEMIEVAVGIKDLNKNTVRESNFEVINNEQYYSELIPAGVTAAIDEAIDRVGSGSAKVVMKIETDQNKEALYRDNLFFGKDIAVACQKELRSILDIFAANEFSAVKLKKVRLEIEIGKEQTTARVVKIETENNKVKPGETVTVNVLLHSYRGFSFLTPFKVKIPEDIEAGKLILTARGGAETVSEEKEETKKETADLDYKDFDSFDDLVTDFLTKPKNYELVLEYYPLLNAGKEEEDETVNDEQIQFKTGTKYHILGEAQLTLEVVK